MAVAGSHMVHLSEVTFEAVEQVYQVPVDCTGVEIQSQVLDLVDPVDYPFSAGTAAGRNRHVVKLGYEARLVDRDQSEAPEPSFAVVLERHNLQDWVHQARIAGLYTVDPAQAQVVQVLVEPTWQVQVSQKHHRIPVYDMLNKVVAVVGTAE